MAAPLIVAKLMEAGLGILGGALLSKGKQAIEEKLGVNVEELLQTDEGRIRLLELQNNHKEFLLRNVLEHRTLDIRETELHNQNTDSARQMQIAALQQDDLFAKRFVYWFSIGWSVCTAAYLAAITFLPIPENNLRFADMIAGFALGTIIATMFNFFLGSSRQSRAKDEALSTIIDSISSKK